MATASKKQENGYYYNLNTGVFEGSVSDSTGDKDSVFACDGKKDGQFVNPKKISLKHRNFQVCAMIFTKETGTASEECIYFAFATNNWSKRLKKGFYDLLMTGYSSVPQNEKIPLPDTPPAGTKEDARNGWARRGILQMHLGFKDPTNGASYWDGTDFLAWGLTSPYQNNEKSHPKFREYKKITIPKAIYDGYLAANLKGHPKGTISYTIEIKKVKKTFTYSLPADVFKDKKNWTTGNFVYETGAKVSQSIIATVRAGHSIFWKVL